MINTIYTRVIADLLGTSHLSSETQSGYIEVVTIRHASTFVFSFGCLLHRYAGTIIFDASLKASAKKRADTAYCRLQGRSPVRDYWTRDDAPVHFYTM